MVKKKSKVMKAAKIGELPVSYRDAMKNKKLDSFDEDEAKEEKENGI